MKSLPSSRSTSNDGLEYAEARYVMLDSKSGTSFSDNRANIPLTIVGSPG